MKKIFIVEDDTSIAQELVSLLASEGYEADYIRNFDHTAEDIMNSGADLVLLDINIPGLNGEMILREVRKHTDMPIIMVTSKTGEADELISMSYGADDYITKPYNPMLLLLRIGAVLKRTAGNQVSSDSGKYRDATVDFARATIERGEDKCSLTKNEMLIFRLLLEQEGKIVSRDDMMTVLWDNEEYINDNALTVNISRLRGKLSELGYENAIETKKKLGYLLK